MLLWASYALFKSATCGAYGPVHTDGSTPRFRHTWTYEIRSVRFKLTGDSDTTSPAANGTAKLEKAVFLWNSRPKIPPAAIIIQIIQNPCSLQSTLLVWLYVRLLHQVAVPQKPAMSALHKSRPHSWVGLSMTRCDSCLATTIHRKRSSTKDVRFL